MQLVTSITRIGLTDTPQKKLAELRIKKRECRFQNQEARVENSELGLRILMEESIFRTCPCLGSHYMFVSCQNIVFHLARVSVSAMHGH